VYISGRQVRCDLRNREALCFNADINADGGWHAEQPSIFSDASVLRWRIRVIECPLIDRSHMVFLLEANDRKI
jgi:hypothetical protein